jgi:hypothetical protein
MHPWTHQGFFYSVYVKSSLNCCYFAASVIADDMLYLGDLAEAFASCPYLP